MAGVLAAFPTIAPWMAIIATGLILGVYWTLQPAYMNKYMINVMKSEDLAYGHTSSIGTWIAATLGKYVGKPEESTEDLDLPESLDIFKDTVISLSIVLGVFTVILALIAGPQAVGAFSGETNYLTYAMIEGFKFGGGISIMLYGVRLIIGELVPAFRGVAKVLVPARQTCIGLPDRLPLSSYCSFGRLPLQLRWFRCCHAHHWPGGLGCCYSKHDHRVLPRRCCWRVWQ